MANNSFEDKNLIVHHCFTVAAGAPSQPIVDEITKNSAALSWKKPSNDGGSKLTGYVVEKKKKGEDWTECAEVPANQTSATVPNLKVGRQSDFYYSKTYIKHMFCVRKRNVSRRRFFYVPKTYVIVDSY